MNLKGKACYTSSTGVVFCNDVGTDPTIQSNIAAEQRKVNSDLSPLKVYPLISLGFSYKF